MLACFLFVVRVSVVVWPGGWRPLWNQSRWYDMQIVRVIIRIHDNQAYKRQLGRLSKDGLYLQFFFGLLLYRLVYIYSPIGNDVIVTWSYVYLIVLRLQYWFFQRNPICVTGLCCKAPGPCLKALVRQLGLPGSVTKGKGEMWGFVFYTVSCCVLTTHMPL